MLQLLILFKSLVLALVQVEEAWTASLAVAQICPGLTTIADLPAR